MYLAGHLWHYAIVYKMFMVTRYAEILWKAITACMHSAIILIVTEMARKIWRNKRQTAQLIGFILATNHFMVRSHQQVNNDDILELYAILTILLMAIDKPVWSVACLSLSLSIKAGAMLLIPTTFGWIQYYYGTLKLI